MTERIPWWILAGATRRSDSGPDSGSNPGHAVDATPPAPLSSSLSSSSSSSSSCVCSVHTAERIWVRSWLTVTARLKVKAHLSMNVHGTNIGGEAHGGPQSGSAIWQGETADDAAQISRSGARPQEAGIRRRTSLEPSQGICPSALAVAVLVARRVAHQTAERSPPIPL